MSDFGRTWVVGRDPIPEEVELYERWMAVVDAAYGAIRPGATLGDVGRAAVAADASAGGERPWLPHFYLAHGIGVESAEMPMIGTDLGQDFDDGFVLEANMLLVLEPIAWRDGFGGYRAEEIVAVTEHGCRLLGADHHYLPFSTPPGRRWEDRPDSENHWVGHDLVHPGGTQPRPPAQPRPATSPGRTEPWATTRIWCGRERVLKAMAERGLDVLVLGRQDDADYASGMQRLWVAGTRPFGAGCVVVAATGRVHLLSSWDAGIPRRWRGRTCSPPPGTRRIMGGVARGDRRPGRGPEARGRRQLPELREGRRTFRSPRRGRPRRRPHGRGAQHEARR